MSVKAIIFDMDGTILDTLDELSRYANKVLARHNLPTHPLMDYKQLLGAGARELMLKASGLKDPAKIDILVEEYLDEYKNSQDEYSKIFPGIPEVLDALVQKNIKLCILSNKQHNYTLRSAERFFSKWPFEVVLGLRTDVPKKPDPAAAFEIARQLNINPSSFLFIGDTSIDMLTGKAAGMTAVGVTWGFRTEQELLDHGADVIVNLPQEILKKLSFKID